MPDRLAEVIENHIKRLRRSLESMESEKLRTHHNNIDTIDESIEERRVWIADLEAALNRHRLRATDPGGSALKIRR